MSNINKIVDFLHREHKLFSDKEGVFPFYYENYGEKAKIIVVTGDNASGKSFLVKDLRSCAKKVFGIKSIIVSIKERLNPTIDRDTEKRRIFCIQDETGKSTGVSSVEVIKRSLSTLEQWSKEDQFILILDEPETGLAQGYEYALGKYIADNIKNMQDNPNIAGVVIVSHSKSLVKGIYESQNAMSFIHMGREKLMLNEWINKEDKKTVDELLSLMERGNQQYKEVEEISQKYNVVKSK